MSEQTPMPEDINGVLVFPPGVPIELPAGLPPMPANVYSEFGFKLIVLDEGDIEEKVWVVATDEDDREINELLSARLEVPKADERPSESAAVRAVRCSLWNGVCRGQCAGLLFCRGIYHPKKGLIGCKCI
jgi:hypothetical protein